MWRSRNSHNATLNTFAHDSFMSSSIPSNVHLLRSRTRRTSSTRSPSSASSSGTLGPRLLRLQPLPQHLLLSLSFVVDESVNPNLVTKVFNTSLAHVNLLRVLPPACNGSSGASESTRVLQHTVVLEEFVCGLSGGRERFDGRFVVAVAGRSPFLGSRDGASEAHAEEAGDVVVGWRRRASVGV